MTDSLRPRYLRALESGALEEKVGQAYWKLEACSVCPRRCGVNRLKEERGACNSGALPVVASFNAHFGEEAPLSGCKGSGTIFFSNCALRCVYCQNADISQRGLGTARTCQEVAEMMLALQREGCHNINLVTPTHFVPQIIRAVHLAAGQGLHVPIVYNTGGYDALASLRLLDDVVDVYLADLKYGDNDLAVRYSAAPSYVQVSQTAVKEMHRQVGDLAMDDGGIAQRGLMIRHLVLPEGIGGTESVMRFLAEEVSRDTYVNLMSQYRPCHLAAGYPAINRRITRGEFAGAREILRRFGIGRGEVQTL